MKNTDKPTTAAALRSRIEDRFDSIPKYAESIGLSKAYVYRVLDGRACPTLDAARRMARPLGMTLDEIAMALGRPWSRDSEPAIA